jgi:short-subunit dehydrogenase
MTTATRPPAVVTGASGGIGLAPAKQFARHVTAMLPGPVDTEYELRSAASRVLPDEAKAKQQGKMMKPGSADA